MAKTMYVIAGNGYGGLSLECSHGAVVPVYRVTTVVVNSNIDSVLDDRRTASGDQVSLQVKAAAEVQGNNSKTYSWSRENKISAMTSEKDYVLEGSEPFATGGTYTAVYKETPWKVRYHGADGDVCFPRLTSAPALRKVEVPAVDENGKPVYDADGNCKRLRLRAFDA